MIAENSILGFFISWTKLFGYFFAIFTFDYLNIPQEQFSILGMLMVIDTFTGIAKQYRIDPRGITSHALATGVLKKFVTVLILYVIALIGKGVGLTPIQLMEWGLSLLIMAEGYSAIQNIYAVRTGVVLPEYDVISIILNKLGVMIRIQFDKLGGK